MELRTQIPLQQQEHNQVDYDSKIVLFGSCFTENISKKLHYFKFRNFANPFGILFQPKAIEKIIVNAINEKVYTEDDIFFYNERWHCFESHSALSDPSKKVLLKRLNSAIQSTYQQIQSSTHIIISLGTSWTYRFIETDTLVANCHKVPQKKFLKEILSIDEIVESLEATIALIRSINKNTSILFTVSPVRHLKDGFTQNTQSKAHLIAAVHQVVEPRKNIHYFPSYELLMDELRDYRFYKEDMVHPSQIAVDYVWKLFSTVWVSETAQHTMKEIEVIQKGLSHKPFNPNSEQHLAFLNSLEQKMETLRKAFPFINFFRIN